MVSVMPVNTPKLMLASRLPQRHKKQLQISKSMLASSLSLPIPYLKRLLMDFPTPSFLVSLFCLF